MAGLTPEKRVQNKILKYLERESEHLPLYYERRQAGGFNYKKGLPDIYFVLNGHHVEVEVKADEEKERTPAQEKWELRFRSLNIPYILVYDIDDFTSYFEALKKDFL